MEHLKHFGLLIWDTLDCSRLRNKVCTIILIGVCVHYDMSVIALIRMLQFVHSLGVTSDSWIDMWMQKWMRQTCVHLVPSICAYEPLPG
jgi:hypothetical protein